MRPPGAQRSWTHANGVVNDLISAGRYSDALAVEKGFDQATLQEAAREPSMDSVLLQINLAEALYNLGRWEEALRRLAPLDGVASVHRFCRASLQVQRAWIASHAGQGAEARSLLGSASLADFPPAYCSELYYTHAAASVALREFERAAEEVRQGIGAAVRASSTRNGLFLLGRIAIGAGHPLEADRHFEAGCEHDFKGQGGDGLLAWGDCYRDRKRPEHARHLWRLTLLRDPESESAALAKKRI